jgi:hypothetical protein
MFERTYKHSALTASVDRVGQERRVNRSLLLSIRQFDILSDSATLSIPHTKMRLSASVPALAAAILTLPLLLNAHPTPGPDIESLAGEPYPTTVLPASSNTSNGMYVLFFPLPNTPTHNTNPHSPLVTFYILWGFLLSFLPSFAPTFYGRYEQCYNLPSPFSFNTGSKLPGPPSSGCRIYPNANCYGSPTDALPAGIGIWSGDSGSFICYEQEVVTLPSPPWIPTPTLDPIPPTT